MDELMNDLLNETDEQSNEVQDLTWAIIDEHASDADVARLEHLLLDDEEARQIYITCVQMHVDLQYLLGGKRFTLPKLPPKPTAQKKSTRAALPLVEVLPLGCDVPIVNGFLP
jgi:hypothetical protein